MKLPLPTVLLYKLLVLSIVLCVSSYVTAQTVDYGKSYINLNKGTTGGTMEPGDILQIKATFVVKSGTLDSCGFFDNIPAGTTYIPGSLAVLTNEGKIYKSFTDAPGDDCGRITGSAVTINLGYNTGAGKQASAFRRGQIKNSDKPSFYGGTCIMVASYKIKITAALGSQINIGGGSVSYKNGSNPITTSFFPTDNVAIFTNYGLCSNSVGANALGTEFNGTFGSGKNKNRGISANVPPSYTYAAFASNNPNDYYYGVSNNTSTAGAGYSTSNSWPKPDPSPTSHRVFSVWDIIGDHTGAVSPTLGNPPADTVNKNNGGYMLVINASYRIDSAFYQNITGLCPNTYYEFSLWIRNICSKCGCDSNGKGATGGAGYIATAPGDSSGVKPNLTLAIDGIDYYTTGDVAYNGQWIKKGFTYLTGPLQTSLTAMVRNNAPGGGGNDWAIDDIALATCMPDLDLKPSPNLTVCVGNQVDMSSVISCYFSNYIYWEWEKSTDNGVTWTNTGVSGVGSPVFIAGQWQYTATYPTFLADITLNNARFRIKVASTVLNLNNSGCSFTASTIIQVLTSLCQFLPAAQLTSFKGKVTNTLANLEWATVNEATGLYFEIEKSTDATHFQKIGTVNAVARDADAQHYLYTDNEPLTAITYYRIKLITPTGFTYSHVVTLYTGNINFEIKSLLNPFNSYISFDAITPGDMKATISLFDGFGRLVKQKEESLYKGFNKITITDLGALSDGTYFLRIQADDRVINKRIIKIKN
ncbi:MAG: T9SS type A sorting domain-containing protein [Chitinophagaceae bacterium]